jgi:phosphatidylserine/phosphatidylglycerophosphate/cardiolipin synthase-like enzyme
MNAIAELFERIERPEGVRRLGQALWMMVGERMELGSLLWARPLLGANGDALLWRALLEQDCVREPGFELRPHPLSSFLCRLWKHEPDAEPVARLVWTLPLHLAVDGVVPDSYVQTAIGMVASAQASITLVSPYLEPRGMGQLHDGLLGALYRGAAVHMLTHDVEDMSSLASASLESLRRDSVGLPGLFTVFTASTMPQALLHLKIVVADESRAIVGSANLTGKGFGTNLEAGVVLGPNAAAEIGRVLRAVISSGLVTRAFANRKLPR